MAGEEEYLAAKITAWAIFPDLDNLRFDDVISVSATFALNSIPTASIVVAVGKTFKDGGEEIATIHTNRQRIRARERAQIFVKISDLVGRQLAITPGTYKAFDGYVAGIGYQRSNNHANYVINLIHWLDDLNNSSAINGNWFPGVPHDWAQQAVSDQLGANGSLSAFSATPGVASNFCTPKNLETDVWDKVIKPLLLAVAGFPSGKEQKRKMPAGGTVDLRNDAAKEALEKMPGKAPNYKKLGMKLGGGACTAANLPKSIAAFFTQSIGSSFVQNSMWAKLLNDYASQFFFAISPAVDWATPIPFCAGLRGTEAAKLITAKEYNFANFNANMSQLLEAIYIYYPLGSATNLAVGPSDSRLSFYRPWGSYPEPSDVQPDEMPKGLKLFKNAPAWLANLDPTYLRTPNALVNRKDMQAPRADNAGGKGCEPAQAHKDHSTVVKKIAEHWYYTEILQQRYGELAGPLRFDIAPGSIVKIQTPPRDQDLKENNPFVVASVISVSYVINAERATAGTSFAIAHQKTDAENKTKLYSTPEPPLYKDAWFGDVLQNPS